MGSVFFTLVEKFEYPIHVTTLEVAYRTIAYGQHPRYGMSPTPMVDYPERQINVHYFQSETYHSLGKKRMNAMYWATFMGQSCYSPVAAFRCRTPPGDDLANTTVARVKTLTLYNRQIGKQMVANPGEGPLEGVLRKQVFSRIPVNSELLSRPVVGDLVASRPAVSDFIGKSSSSG